MPRTRPARLSAERSWASESLAALRDTDDEEDSDDELEDEEEDELDDDEEDDEDDEDYDEDDEEEEGELDDDEEDEAVPEPAVVQARPSRSAYAQRLHGSAPPTGSPNGFHDR